MKSIGVSKPYVIRLASVMLSFRGAFRLSQISPRAPEGAIDQGAAQDHRLSGGPLKSSAALLAPYWGDF
jgi:hypothetical protein